MARTTPLILLADDDPGARLLQSTALEHGGFAVEVVVDGAAALDAYERLRPDCLVLDVVMPKLGGFDVCREIRARPDGQHVPILILTSRDDLDSISSAYTAGATDFAQKGINPMLLVERVRFMLRAKQLQDELIVSESRLAQAQSVARIGHWEFDTDGRTVSISPMALEILGIPRSGARSIKAFRHFVHPDDLQRVTEHQLTAQSNQTRTSIDFRVRTTDGSERIVHMEGESKLYEPGMEQHPRVVTLQDITQLRRAEDHARLLAHFDMLTGLPNRAFLREQLALKIKNRESREQVVLAIIDIEHLNRFNHSYGTIAGDLLLTAFGDRLKEGLALDNPRTLWGTLQSPIIVARTGGDEFSVAVSLRQEGDHVANLLQYLSELLRAPFVIEGKEIVVGATLGAAVYPDDAIDADALLSFADAALHQAKQSARGAY
ncbi:MAG TPA: diguanylate cyclase, partial [Steroidobacteraceae bacterium]|nr:diguanylate cyclase [Steroidobacteraceae bacterium]